MVNHLGLVPPWAGLVAGRSTHTRPDWCWIAATGWKYFFPDWTGTPADVARMVRAKETAIVSSLQTFEPNSRAEWAIR